MKSLWNRQMHDDLVNRVARLAPDRPPQWGRMSGLGHGVLAYKHTDHHLRQFGV